MVTVAEKSHFAMSNYKETNYLNIEHLHISEKMPVGCYTFTALILFNKNSFC